MPPPVQLAALLAPSIGLPLSGAILSLSYYSTPILRAANTQSTPLSLQQLRSLFSSGSHIFPQLASLSAAFFGYLAYSLPHQRSSYLLAAATVASILPFTVVVMLPASNQRLIDLDELAKKDKDAVKKRSGEVDAMLARFGKLNAVRAVLVAAGSVLGLWTTLQG
jgi:hypothetical protein